MRCAMAVPCSYWEVPVSGEQLPVLLPEVKQYQPDGTGESPLATVPSWVDVPLADRNIARREANTMPQWAGSCWYFLRFIDPHNKKAPIDPALETYWVPVDLYVGGDEYAVLHLLYARFWHKVLYDAGVVSTKELSQRLVNQGMILAELEHARFEDADASDDSGTVSAQNVEVDAPKERAAGSAVFSVRVPNEDTVKAKNGDHFVLKRDANVRLTSRAQIISKSR